MAEENKESQGGSIFGNLIKTIIVGDLKSTGQWVYNQIVKPTAQSTLNNIITQGSHYMIYGSPGNTQTQQGQKTTTYTDYWKQKNAQQTGAPVQPALPAGGSWTQTQQSGSGNAISYNMITYENHNQAGSVLHQMQLQIQSTRYVTIGDYYRYSSRADLVNNNFTAENFGWTNLDGAYVYSMGSRYAIAFPTKPVRVVALNG